jgi:phosphoesterase RecJ-like protein
LFKFPSTTSRTLAIGSRLLESGIDNGLFNILLFDNFTEPRLRYWGQCFHEKMRLIPDLHLAIITIPKDELSQKKLKTSDLEGLAAFPLILEDIYLAVLFVEREKYVKISLRSKFDFPSNTMTRKYFNGGGHLNAAGGEINLHLEEAVSYFLEKLAEFEVYLKDKTFKAL